MNISHQERTREFATNERQTYEFSFFHYETSLQSSRWSLVN